MSRSNLSIFVPLFFSMINLFGCGDSSSANQSNDLKVTTPVSAKPAVVTSDKAQQAIDQWADGARSHSCREQGELCSVTIQGGVREIPQENKAIAELKFTDFVYKPSNESNERIYSGDGRATFVKYTDGRWSLSEIRLGDIYASTTWKPGIDVR